MPKMKTHRGAAKRFEIKRTGKVMRRKAYGSHILTKKSSKRKRSFRQKQEVSPQDIGSVRRMLRQG
ncbi:MAG: 50S ribosomal protein L35 [Candidatus Solincola sediminis]|uniref:Large ribosomal subunit protein bL35 n=1 Tax=Candidatus Solincola sediminis TaxID=1797199 RepID=A0A1F2WGL8_9ACTN|nr:MAG: 50S ribosomal protein L35 [Candidatus Solincola sediminis]OFW58271.1 MAG: 50S ribosomal protein L35 [Candidatus Solincola sediminis]